MSTVENPPAETMTDLDYAIHLMMTGQKDPNTQTRVQAETAKITEAILSMHDTLNIAVDLIRESCEDE
jgi:hypothetical protein